MALTTIVIRFLPFILFKNKTPDFILYLGKMLPMCAMAMLVVYCYRNLTLTNFLPDIICGIIVVISYKWKHSTGISIVLGTVLYMFLIQRIF